MLTSNRICRTPSTEGTGSLPARRHTLTPAARHARCERAFILARYDSDLDRLPPGIAKCIRDLEIEIARGTLN